MRMIRAVLALTLSSSVAAARAAELVQAPLPGDPMKVSIHRLANGLTVYLSPNPIEPRVTAWVSVRAGSKNDPDESTGLAHYLEHMLFKGSTRLGTLDYAAEKRSLDQITALYEEHYAAADPKRREEIYKKIDAASVEATKVEVPNELDRLYNSLGFQGINAFTSDERTVFVANFPANRAEVWAKAEADRFAHPVFRLFQSELEAVYEEKNRSLDDPGTLLSEALERRLYKKHPYGQHTTLGTIEHLKNPSLKRMYAFHDRWYRPNNMALALSGDFDRDAMLALIEKTFGAWEAGPLPDAKTWDLPKPKGVERVEVRYEAEEQVVLAWPTARHNDPDEDALTVMDMVFDNAQAGLVNLRLNQAQKVKGAGSYPAFHNDAGAWYVWAVPKKDQTLEQAETLLLEVVDALKRGDFSEGMLQAIITDFEVSEKYKLESNDSRVAQMADAFASYEDWPHAAGRLDRLRKVTKADVVRAANRYLGGDRVVAYRRLGKPEIPSITKPGFSTVKIDPSRRSPYFDELLKTPAAPLEPRWLADGKDYEIRRFPWGKLYAAKNPVNDLFALTFDFERGQKDDRKLCAALDLLELSGAGDLDADAYKTALYALGAKMSVSCGEDSSSVGLTGLEANFEKSLELLFRRFEAPNVATDTLKKMVDVQIGAHADNKKNPSYVEYALKEYAMRGPQSSVLDEPTDKELEALKTGELVGRIRTLFDHQRRLLYVGVRPPEAVAPLATAGRTAFKTAGERRPHRYLKPGSPRVVFAHRDMVQSQLGLYAVDGELDPRDAVDAKYYNTYMDSTGGVIWQEVREARSLAYSAGGGYGIGGRKGDENVVWAGAGCQADKTVETATLLRDLLTRMPSSEGRFAEARKTIEQEYRTDVVNFRNVPGTVLYWEEQGLPPGDPRPPRFERALRYTLKDLEAFARRFEGKAITVHVLGPKDRLDLKGLSAIGKVEEVGLDRIFPY